jgi:hypothetical protein
LPLPKAGEGLLELIPLSAQPIYLIEHPLQQLLRRAINMPARWSCNASLRWRPICTRMRSISDRIWSMSGIVLLSGM